MHIAEMVKAVRALVSGKVDENTLINVDEASLILEDMGYNVSVDDDTYNPKKR